MADLNTTYSILITGTGRFRESKPREFDISWVVFQNDIEFSRGNSKESRGSPDPAHPGWMIGEFRAVKGEEYRVVIRSGVDLPDLDVFKPQFEITGGYFKDAVIGKSLDPFLHNLAWRGLAGSGIVFLALGSLFEWRRPLAVIQ